MGGGESHMRWGWAITAAFFVALAALGGAAGQASPAQSGFRTLTGAEASAFVVPADMRLAASFDQRIIKAVRESGENNDERT